MQDGLGLVFEVEELPVVPNLGLDISACLDFHVEPRHDLLDDELGLRLLLVPGGLVGKLFDVGVCLRFLVVQSFVLALLSDHFVGLDPLHSGLNHGFLLADDAFVGVSSHDPLVPHDVAGFLAVLHLLDHLGRSVEFVVLVKHFRVHFI